MRGWRLSASTRARALSTASWSRARSCASWLTRAGFWAKLAVIQAVLDIGSLWLAMIAVLFSVIGAYYYLRVVKLMYFDEPADHQAIAAPLDMRIALGVNAMALLVIGLVPQRFMEICAYAMVKSLS